MKEVYVVYGVDPDILSPQSSRMLIGEPCFMAVFDNETAAKSFFRKKVLEIARSKKLNNRFFSHLADEELFVGTYELREYTDDEINTLPVFISYLKMDDSIHWSFYKNDIDYDLENPLPPKVCMKKRVVWLDEVERNEDE